MGLTVVLQGTGEEVGRVTDVFDGTGTHDVLRIQLAPALLQRLAAAASSGEEEAEADAEAEAEEGASEGAGAAGAARHVLLPFAKAMVPVVDVAGRRMEITPPEGLLELAAPSNMRRVRKENRGKRERRRTRPRGQPAPGDGAAPGTAAAAAASS